MYLQGFLLVLAFFSATTLAKTLPAEGSLTPKPLHSRSDSGLPDCSIPCVNAAIRSTGCAPMDVLSNTKPYLTII